MMTARFTEMKRYEEALWKNGLRSIAGVDEVGRGPLAGPVVAAAVVLSRDFNLIELNDSKKLSETKREELYVEIVKSALAIGIGIRDHNHIDRVNILQATKDAMTDAVSDANLQLTAVGAFLEHVLIDAVSLEKITIPQTAIVKGDASSVSIAAASVVAKVTRDRMMYDYHKIYPGYAFDRNKGYGTAAHYQGLKENGPCAIHRMTFLKTFMGK